MHENIYIKNTVVYSKCPFYGINILIQSELTVIIKTYCMIKFKLAPLLLTHILRRVLIVTNYLLTGCILKKVFINGFLFFCSSFPKGLTVYCRNLPADLTSWIKRQKVIL